MRSAEERLEFKRKLEARTAAFAIAVFRLVDSLPPAISSRVIAFQLGKSASSVGANYREANRAESPEDFVHKISITLKECSESLYWLELIAEMYPDNENGHKLSEECGELVRLYQTIMRSTRLKQKEVKG